MAQIDDLIINSSLKTDKIDAGAKSLQQKLSSIGSGSSLLAGAAGGAALGAVTSLFSAVSSGAQAAFSSVASLTAESFKLADDLSASADILGLTADKYLTLTHVAKKSEISTQDLDAAISKLNVNLAEASATGKGNTNDALERLGLSAKELSQLDVTSALKRISDGLATVENHGERAALQGDIFGNKLGPKLSILLGQGSDGIQGLIDNVNGIGPSIDNIDIQRANLLNNSFDDLFILVQKVGLKLASEFGPSLASGIDNFIQWSQSILNMWDTISFVLKLGFREALKFTDFILENTKTIRQILVDLSSMGGSEKAFRAIGMTTAADFLRDFDAAKVSLNTLLDQKPGAQLTNWLDSVESKMSQLAPTVETNRAAIDALGDAQAKLAKDSKSLIVELEKTVLTFGMSANQQKVWELAQQGADKATLNRAGVLLNQIDALEKFKKANEEATKQKEKAKDEAKTLIESVKTPLEKFADFQKKLTEQFQAGLLGQGPEAVTIFQRALNGQLKSLHGKIDVPEKQLLGASQVGSVEARSLALQAQLNPNKNDPAKETAVGIKQLVSQNERLIREISLLRKERKADVLDGV